MPWDGNWAALLSQVVPCLPLMHKAQSALSVGCQFLTDQKLVRVPDPWIEIAVDVQSVGWGL